MPRKLVASFFLDTVYKLLV